MIVDVMKVYYPSSFLEGPGNPETGKRKPGNRGSQETRNRETSKRTRKAKHLEKTKTS